MRERADKVTSRTSFREVSEILEYAANQVVVAPLLTRQGLAEIYAWMAEGIPFRIVFEFLWVRCRMGLEPNTVKTWSYFRESVLDRLRD